MSGVEKQVPGEEIEPVGRSANDEDAESTPLGSASDLDRPGWKTSLRQTLTLVGLGVTIVALLWLWENGPQLIGRSSSSASAILADQGAAETAPKIGHLAPDFVLEDLEGSIIRLSDLRGQVVVLNFWASWCPPCRAEIPDLEALHQDYRDKGVVLLAVNIREDRETVARFAQAQGITFTILLDPQSLAVRQYQPSYIPTTFFIGADGIIRDMNVGGMSRATMDWKVERSR